MDSNKNTASKSHILLLSILLILVASSSLYYYLNTTSPELFKDFSSNFSDLQAKISSFKKTTDSQDIALDNLSSNSTPQTNYTLPPGEQVYEFSHGENVKGPKPKSLTLTPLSPREDRLQSASISISDSLPIKKITLTVVSDTLVTAHELTLTSGTEKDGIWSGSWSLNDTIDNRYAVRTTIIGDSGKYDSAMWFINNQLWKYHASKSSPFSFSLS